MDNIPIFDSLTHPTLDGNWILPKWPACSSIEELQKQMNRNNVCGAFAVGMKGIGGYEENAFVSMIKEKGQGKLFPIAFFPVDHSSKSRYELRLLEIKEKGYVGIKLHPRMGNFNLEDKDLPFIINKAGEMGMIVMICTYPYGNPLSCSPIVSLSNLLYQIRSNTKVILLHGGVIKLMELMEVIRSMSNILMDLSFTMCRYEGSSIDMDIRYLFQTFDQRICVGSDFPEIDIYKLRLRFNYFSKDISREKAVNIAYGNITKFVGVNLR